MQDESSIDSALVTQSLQKVVKGAGIVFIGTIVGMILGFLQRVLIARNYSQEEYGIFSLALVLFNIFAIVATLGLQEGVARQIAYYRGKKDMKKVKGVIISAIEISLVASIVFSLFLFFGSDFISIKIFHEKGLISTLKILSVALPFFVLINVFTAIARGFNDVKPRVYFQDILRNVVFALFIIIIIWIGPTFLDIIYAFSLSIIISCFLLIIYVMKKISISVRGNNFSVKKHLLLFSLPLLALTMLNMIINWSDTLMLGYFKDSKILGLYNGAVPLARLIPIVLSSAGFIYVPVLSELYSKNRIKEISRIYQTSTKWIFSFTLPIFFILFLFPEIVLRLTFGPNYIAASSVLRILCISLMVNTFFGLNGLTLMILGKTRFLLFMILFTAISNVILNAILIPYFGIEGAAIASLFAYSLSNIIGSLKLYYISKIHPFTWNYLKPIGISGILLVSIYIFASQVKIELWMLPFFLFIFLLSYFVMLLLTKSFDREDVEMLLAVEKRTGINFGVMKKLLKWFI